MGICSCSRREPNKRISLECVVIDTNEKPSIVQDDSMQTISKVWSTNVSFRHQSKHGPFFAGGNETIPEYEEERDTAKTEQEIAFIDKVCKPRIIFHGLDDEQRRSIIEQMWRINCPEGTKIITEGDVHAEEFYVVQEGNFDIFVNETKVASSIRGEGFGELALLYNSPRAATVVATENSKVFAVNRSALRTVQHHTDRERGKTIQALLKTLPEINSLPDRNIALIQMALVEYIFDKDEVILRQGDDGDRFYLIASGACTWEKKLQGGEVLSGDIGLGEYFGEMALLKREKHAATIIAKTPVKTFTLSKEDFHEHIGVGRSFLKRLSNNHSKKAQSLQTPPNRIECSLQDLVSNTVGLLGKGAFGIVTLVEDKKSGTSYALKAIKKCKVVRKHQQKHVVEELRVMRMLAKLNCCFLTNLLATYKDSLRVYYLLEACLGGELFSILRRKRKFQEKTARFYIGCVVEAFDCMHSHNIIYRDLKPENLVLDARGYAKVTDFGFAKVVVDRTFTMCGTPDYLAPEIVSGQGHGRAVDWWTLGILTYEMLASRAPFYSNHRINTYRMIITGSLRFPTFFSNKSIGFISSLLRVRPVKRLGMQCEGTKVVRNHCFFDSFSWNSLQERTMTPPIINKVRSVTDLGNFVKIGLKDDIATPVRKEDDFDAEF